MSTPADTRKGIQIWREKLQDEVEQFYLKLFDDVAESGLPEGDIARLGQALLRAKQESLNELRK